MRSASASTRRSLRGDQGLDRRRLAAPGAAHQLVVRIGVAPSCQSAASLTHRSHELIARAAMVARDRLSRRFNARRAASVGSAA